MTIRTFKHLLLAAKTSASEALGRSNVAKAKSAIAPQGKPAYLAIDIDIKDEERFEKEYVSKVIPLVQTFGGVPIVSDDQPVPLEGPWLPKRIVILQFPTKDQLLKFFNSPEYRPYKLIRQANSEGTAIAVDAI